MNAYDIYRTYYLDAPPAKRQKVRLSYHTLFWLLFLGNNLFYVLFSLKHIANTDHPEAVIFTISLYYIRYIPCYYLAVGLYTRLQKRLSFIPTILVVSIILLLFFHGLSYVQYYLTDQIYGIDALPRGYYIMAQAYLDNDLTHARWLQLLVFDLKNGEYLFIPLVIKAFKTIFEKELALKQLQTSHLQMELKVLRAQLNPHFIFNVINAAYARVLPIEHEAADYLLKVSDILRFSLYETNEEFIALAKEVHCVKEYVDLEMIRHEERVSVRFDQTGTINPAQYIPTFLLVTLVENAFKHGVYASRHASWVDIRLVVEPRRLLFTFSNSKPANSRKEPSVGGLGLVNIRKRLELYYANHYQLNIQDTDHQFCIQGEVPLMEFTVAEKKRELVEILP
jgi:two-component system, LytTR family, sensor kinase